ncbi:MAG: archease [Anaerolineales bacterium]|nr:archease [Anaerolineales bacterium]
MMQPTYEEIDHTADWALRVRGQNLTDLFRNAALGMLSLLEIEPLPGNSESRSFELKAEDTETLLVTWLEELLYPLEVEGAAVVDFQVDVLEKVQLKATVKLNKIASIKKEIKAVTFNELDIRAAEFGYETIIVFDV